MESLEDYRDKIDRIDRELVRLFEERMNTALKIGEYKKDRNLPIFNGSREKEVIQKNIDLLTNKEYSDLANRFFNDLMEISRSLQGKLIASEENLNIVETVSDKHKYKLGFPGVIGSFSEEAMHKYFKDVKEAKSYEEFYEVFEALKNKEIDYGIVPIENSSTGAISQVYDLLGKYGFYIVGEECIRIEQHLIGIKGATLETIDEIYSHTQGFEQSTEFLRAYPHWSLIPYHNTSISAKLIHDLNDSTKAAIASKRAAKIYDLEIIKESINNQKDNFTKFIIIGRELESDISSNKVSVMLSLDDEAGTLYNLLRHFAENNINMIKIESRPNKTESWKYLLYVDFEGNLKNEEVASALKLIEERSAYFKLLGCYKDYNLN